MLFLLVGSFLNKIFSFFTFFSIHSASKMTKIAFFVVGVIFCQNSIVFYVFTAHSASKTTKIALFCWGVQNRQKLFFGRVHGLSRIYLGHTISGWLSAQIVKNKFSENFYQNFSKIIFWMSSKMPTEKKNASKTTELF